MSEQPSDEDSVCPAAGAAQSGRSRESPLSFSRKHKLPGVNRDYRVKKKKESDGEFMKTSEPGSDEDSVCSAKTQRSIDVPLNFSAAPAGTRKFVPPNTSGAPHLKTSDPGSDEDSVCSAKTHRSRDVPLNFSAAPAGTSRRTTLSSPQKDTLKEFDSKAMAFVKHALEKHKKVLSGKLKAVFEEEEREAVVHDELLLECDEETCEAALKIALHVLRTMKEEEHVQTLEQSHYGELVLFQRHLKSFLKNKHAVLQEVINKQQWPVPLKRIYTKLCLIEGGSGDVNREHEVRLIEAAFNRRRRSETVIRTEDIFKPHPKQQRPIRTVLTNGIAGIGKTVLAHKFMLDWAEDQANGDVQLVFSLPFRELNMLRNRRCSLMELLNIFTPGLTGSGITDLQTYKVLLVLDGLDECRLTLDFGGSVRCRDATEPASVEVLLTNLMDGNLLPKASLWITTRPAAASSVPPQYIDRVTEIRGFNNMQKEQYFYKKIEDEDLAARVVANIKSTRSLYIMCHVPVFCWISSIVLGKICAEAGGEVRMPKTLTQMYIHFVTHQTTVMSGRYCGEQQLDPQGNNKVIMALGRLAFQQLEKGNLIFYEEDLTECGIDVKEASVYSGVCTQVFREESWMDRKVFCFVHLSVQEFLAALYVYVTYSTTSENLLLQTPEQGTRTRSVFKLHRAAVDQALCSDNGHLDLFLRFLLGLSLESSQGLLRALSVQVDPCDSQSHKETIKYIKDKVRVGIPPEKYINLFHCLNELKDHSLLEEIQRDLDSDTDSVMEDRSTADWSALVFMLLTSPEKPEEIQLKKYCRTESGLIRLLPAITASRSAALNDCNLTAESCRQLSSALSSSCNELMHLNLSDNNLQDSGIKDLCVGLQSPHCRLKTLKLNRCSLTPACCENLALVLRLKASHLRELDLSDNDIEDSGVELLCGALGSEDCRLEALRLLWCNITEESCSFLASALMSNPFHLKELDLSYNHLGKPAVKRLSEALEEGRCEFTKLRVHNNAEHWFKPGLREYAHEITLDPDTAHRLLVLSDSNRKATWVTEQQCADLPDRFDCWAQVLSLQSLTGRCYWEVEWEGSWAGIGVTYRGIGRKGPGNDSVMGYNKLSWSLHCTAHGYRAYHDYKSTMSPVPLAGSHRLAVYLDFKCGLLSFYKVSPGRSLTHLHTFSKRFTEPLYAIFRVWGEGSSVRLCSEV